LIATGKSINAPKKAISKKQKKEKDTSLLGVVQSGAALCPLKREQLEE